MNHIKATLTLITLLFILSGSALAANLNTTGQWRAWLSDSRQIQRLQNQAYQSQRAGSSAGYRRAAYLYDQMADLHARNATRFQSLSYSSDRSIASQAKYQANGRRISTRQCRDNAQTYRRYASQAARRGR